MRILVSACLLGIRCRYNGEAKGNEDVMRLAKEHELIPFCPEIYGGLPTPREPSEIRDGRVYARTGKDVTEQFRIGAEEAVKAARATGCELAILQDRSPSCGVGTVHNGLFDGGLVPGDGVAAALLRESGRPRRSGLPIVSSIKDLIERMSPPPKRPDRFFQLVLLDEHVVRVECRDAEHADLLDCQRARDFGKDADEREIKRPWHPQRPPTVLPGEELSGRIPRLAHQ